MTPSSPPAGARRPRGRRREADRNDERVLMAAHQAFAELGWNASVTEIARRAGLGMGSLYRRYRGKEELAQHLRIVGMEHLTKVAQAAALEQPNGWSALVRFMNDAVSSSAGTLLPLIGGVLPATHGVEAATTRLHDAVEPIVARARDEGSLRADIGSADLVLLLVHLKAKLPAPPDRARQLRFRYLQMALHGMRSGPDPEPAGPVFPAPDWRELRALWHALPEPCRPTEPGGRP
ncbi:TetR/AcrR family transcriptional regulator [Streptomyces sp. CB09001]|nr:TetR/AcrR family transcriptional regulator [Streptomyces sp. CB09001]